MSQIANAEGIRWDDPSIQVKIKLTDNPDVLAYRKKSKTAFRGDSLVLMHASRDYFFSPGVEIVVPAPVAAGLIQSSATIVGDNPEKDKTQHHLTGEFIPALEIVSHWALGQPEPGRKNVCDECGKSFETARVLAKHILDEHPEGEPVAVGVSHASLTAPVPSKGKK